MNILVNDGMSASGAQMLKDKGYKVFEDNIPQEELVDFMNKEKIDVIYVRSATTVRKDLIDSVESLKLIGRGGVGMDNIDVDYAKSKGIHVINTPAASSRSVAELVFAHMFGLIRYLHDANRQMPLEGEQNFKQLKKSYALAEELKGKTLGILGLGRIGQEVAKIALGIGMKVIGTNSSNSHTNKTITLDFFDGQSLDFVIEVKPIEEVLKESDIITLHLPAQKGHVISEKELNLMKEGSILINAARGGVVDEVALVKALKDGNLKFAALDVFEKEPKPEVHLLMNENLSLSPHIGGSTLQAQERIGQELAEQTIDLLG